MKVEEKIKRILGEARGPTLKANIKKKLNREIINLTTPKNKTQYFDKIPLQPIFDILSKQGVVALQEDDTIWSGFLTGNSATVDFNIAPISSEYKESNWKMNQYVPYTNASLRLQWHKMQSGRYEITSYIG